MCCRSSCSTRACWPPARPRGRPVARLDRRTARGHRRRAGGAHRRPDRGRPGARRRGRRERGTREPRVHAVRSAPGRAVGESSGSRGPTPGRAPARRTPSSPGRLRTVAGTPYQVFTPFSRAWRDRAGPAPEPSPTRCAWRRGVAGEPLADRLRRATSGPRVRRRRWPAGAQFLDDGLATLRRRPGPAGPGRHQPDVAAPQATARSTRGRCWPTSTGIPTPPGEGARRFVAELCWREFYADVLWHHPALGLARPARRARRDARTTTEPA